MCPKIAKILPGYCVCGTILETGNCSVCHSKAEQRARLICVERVSDMFTFNHLQRSGHYMYRTVVTIYIDSLTFNNSTFYPHTVFMCFVWIWEQTAIISLYNINWLVCITEIYPFIALWSLYVPPV